MKEKLTLTIEKEAKERAKRFARRQGTSVSKLIETFLDSVSGTNQDPISHLSNHPVNTGVSNAAEEHDRYLYNSDK